MARSGPITAAQLIADLQTDPEWVSRRNARELDRARGEQQSRDEQAPLLRDLEAAGTAVGDVWDLVNSTVPYPLALPVLLNHMSHPYHDTIRKGIARALAVKTARPLAWERLIALARNGSLSKRVADGVMVALSAMAGPADLPKVVALIADSSIGSSRMFLVRNLMRSKRPEAREALLNLRGDPDLQTEIAARLKIQARCNVR